MAAGDMQPHVSAGGCKDSRTRVCGCTTDQHMLPEATREAANSQAVVTATTGTTVHLH